MTPLDLTLAPPRSSYAELDGLLFLPRTIDKFRASLPGGNLGGYYPTNGPIVGISGFLLSRLDVTEAEFRDAVAAAEDDAGVAAWLRTRCDVSRYPEINETLRRLKPKHATDPSIFATIYAETLAEHPELATILEIIEADDRRLFASKG